MVTWVPSSSTSISANSSANTTITTVTIFEYRLQLGSIISNSQDPYSHHILVRLVAGCPDCIVLHWTGVDIELN